MKVHAERDRPRQIAPLDLLCFALYSTSRAMTGTYRALLAELQLTYPQYLVMMTLWLRSPMRVTEIGEGLFLDSATLTPLLKRLEQMGLVKRSRDKADERVVLVSLTTRGAALRRKAATIPARVQAACGMTDSEMLKLRKALDGLRARLMS